MSGLSSDLARELLAQSLIAWDVAGEVECTSDNIIIVAAKKDIRIERMPTEPLFRWIVTIEGRRRSVISLLAVLRQVREALDPNHVPSRVRLTPGPPVSS